MALKIWNAMKLTDISYEILRRDEKIDEKIEKMNYIFSPSHCQTQTVRKCLTIYNFDINIGLIN